VHRDLGPLVVAVGVGLVVVGALLWAGALGWFGRLPGDIRIEGERTRVVVPFTSMLVASVVLTIFVNVVRRLR
jgi:hypothetical protein